MTESNKLRLCIMQDRLRHGGTERNSIWLANALTGEDLDTHLLLFVHPSGSTDPAVPQWRALRSQRYRLIPDYHAPGLIQTLREIQADVVICMGRNANCHGVRIKKHLPDVRLFTSYRTNRRLPRLYRKSISISDGCIANSEWARQQLIDRQLLPTNRVYVIPNPLIREGLLTLELSVATKNAARRHLGIPENALVCINCAHFVAGKNQSALIHWLHDAHNKRPELMLLMLGEGPTQKRCMGLAKKLQLTSKVRFCGHVEALEPYLQASDLYLSTSLREGSPNALVEAQAAGLPVVAYDTAGSCETFIDKQSGFCIPVNDVEGLAKAVEKLLKEPSKRNACSANARDFAAKQFAPKRISDLYQKTVHASARCDTPD